MTTTTTNYLCIGCPLGCRLEVDEDVESGEIIEVRGFSCAKGDKYARQEHVAPERSVSTTVAISGARYPRLPVKTSAPVPKEMVMDICRKIHTVNVEAPIRMGDVIVPSILGTGVDVVASRDM